MEVMKEDSDSVLPPEYRGGVSVFWLFLFFSMFMALCVPTFICCLKSIAKLAQSFNHFDLN